MIIAAAEGTPFMLNPSFWVLVPLLLFFALVLWMGVHKKIGTALDGRAEAIETELEEARRLREEAQALLASYQRKQKEAEDQAEAIVAQARRDAEAMAAESRQELAARLERRTQQAEEKIANAEAKAVSEVRARAAEMAAAAAEQLIRKDFTASDHAKVIKSGIDQIGKALN